MDKLTNAVQKAANILGRTSIPFWSPRYEAHMSVYRHTCGHGPAC